MTSRSTTPGTVVWITGLPGAGKTTIAEEVHRLLKARSSAVVRLDGDVFREAMGNDLGYDMADRLENARRLSRFCRLLSTQGLDVVCATVSLFHEIHVWNRTNLPRYLEVYLRVSAATLRARDQKMLVSAGKNVVGVDQPFDEPVDAHLVLDNDDGQQSPAQAAARIIALMERS
jgi:adenylylsulfate kinase